MKGVVYEIINSLDGKRYIGSTFHFQKRIKNHFRNLKINKHCNNKFQNAYNKYGRDSFEVVILAEEKDNTKLRELETFYLQSYGKLRLYNIALYAETPALGVSPSAETRKKIGDAHRGNQYSKGKSPSQETREKLRLSSTGKKRSEACRKKISANSKTLNTIRYLGIEARKVKDNNGVIYESMTAAAKFYGIHISTVKNSADRIVVSPRNGIKFTYCGVDNE